MATAAALHMETGGHHKQAGEGVEVAGLTCRHGCVVRGHDRVISGVIGGEPIWMRDGWFSSAGFAHSRNPAGKGSSGASMCCDVPVIHARPVTVGMIASKSATVV